jgi:hypothetical protein
MRSTPLERTKQKLEEKRFNISRSSPRDGAYLFFSFDLVNSTRYKALFPSHWPIVATHFYDIVANEMATRFTSARLWKHMGDEILFYKLITSVDDVLCCLPLASEVQMTAIAVLHQVYPQTRPILSLKGSVWIADVEYIVPSDSREVQLTKRNLVTGVASLTDALDRDFLGPEIDTGFRLGKYVQHRRIVISAHLAAILYRERARFSEIEDRLKIVAYEELKGVWDGRRYPIIWYEEDWPSIASTFLYDEHLISPIVASVRRGLDGEENKLRYIERVFSDLGKQDEVEDLQHVISSSHVAVAPVIEVEIPRDRFAEVHCVAICFDPKGRVLVGKRPARKKRLPGVWEFGCGQLKIGEDFAACLQRTYFEDFGARLAFGTNPPPVATFSLRDTTEHRVIPGIIFAARVLNPAEVAIATIKEKHSEIKWIAEDELAGIRPEEYVPDFLSNVEAARAAIDAGGKQA